MVVVVALPQPWWRLAQRSHAAAAGGGVGGRRGGRGGVVVVVVVVGWGWVCLGGSPRIKRALRNWWRAPLGVKAAIA